MKRLDCPIEGCHATFEAETEEEIMEQAGTHAASKHPDVEMDEEMVAGIKSKILTV